MLHSKSIYFNRNLSKREFPDVDFALGLSWALKLTSESWLESDFCMSDASCSAVLLTMDLLFPQNVPNVTTPTLILSAVLNYLGIFLMGCHEKTRMIDSSGKTDV